MPNRRSQAGSKAAFWIFLSMLLVLALLGGASREDSLAQAAVRSILPLLAGAMVLSQRPAEWRSLVWPGAILCGGAVIAASMLIPLPPSLWLALPGRDLIAQAAPLAGVPQPWRPWALVPPLGFNALFAFIPPACVLAGLIYLSPSQRVALAAPMAGLILFSAVLGVAQETAGPESALRWYAITNQGNGVGLFANRNHQALLLACGLPVLASWVALAPGKDNLRGRLPVALAIITVLLVSLLMTGSRAGLVLGVLGLLGGGWILYPTFRRSRERIPRKWTVIVSGALVCTFGAIAFHMMSSQEGNAVSRLLGLSASDDLRIRALPTLLALARVHFPFGTGLGGFEPVFRAAEPASLLNQTYLNEAHNDYLQLAIEAGIFGLLVALAAFALLIWRGTQLVRRKDAHPSTILGKAGAVILALVAAASAVDYPVRTPLIMAVVMIAAVWLMLPSVPRRIAVDTSS